MGDGTPTGSGSYAAEYDPRCDGHKRRESGCPICAGHDMAHRAEAWDATKAIYAGRPHIDIGEAATLAIRLQARFSEEWEARDE